MAQETSIVVPDIEIAAGGPATSRRRRGGKHADRGVGSVTGIVLAGTQSWGECPLQRIVPRPLVPIANRPLIHHVLAWLGGSGVERTSICGNSSTRALRLSFSTGDGRRTVPEHMAFDFYHDIAPRGPAGCVRDAGNLNPSDTYVVVEGAILPRFDLGDVLSAHRRSGAKLTVVASGGHDASAPLGIYVFGHDVLKHVPPTGYQDIKESLIPRLYQCGESVLVYRTDAPSPRVSGVDSYLAVNDWALTEGCRDGDGSADYRKCGDGWVHRETSVDATARLVGPVLVGRGSAVQRGVTVVGPTSIGAGVIVRTGAVVCRSALWDGVDVGEGALLDRCVATCGAAAGTRSVFRYRVLS